METTTEIQAHPRPGHHKVTWKEFVALPEDDLRELIDGDLIEIEMPTEQHEHVISLLVILIGSRARQRKAGRVYASGYKVRVSKVRGVMPDVQFFRRGNRAPPEGLGRGHPDLAVEVVSPSSRRYDRVTKLNWYAKIGVPEYWIIDPEAKSLERLLLRDGAFATETALLDDALFRPDTFPGLEVPMSELWAAPE